MVISIFCSCTYREQEHFRQTAAILALVFSYSEPGLLPAYQIKSHSCTGFLIFACMPESVPVPLDSNDILSFT
jgi:hypothetical protein